MAEYQTSSEDSSSDDDSMDEMDNTSRSKRSSSGIEWYYNVFFLVLLIKNDYHLL